MGFRLSDSFAYDFFKGTRLGFRFGSHLTEAEFVLHSAAESATPNYRVQERHRANNHRANKYIVSESKFLLIFRVILLNLVLYYDFVSTINYFNFIYRKQPW